MKFHSQPDNGCMNTKIRKNYTILESYSVKNICAFYWYASWNEVFFDDSQQRRRERSKIRFRDVVNDNDDDDDDDDNVGEKD